MKKIINEFLLTGNEFMLELNLQQCRFIYIAYGPFTNHRQRTKKIKETFNLKNLYKNELSLFCFWCCIFW